MSFGHAAYLGIGGYAVGILAHEGIGSGFIQWPVALAASALFALVIGALSLRTRGVYFIMITLAFAQMAYYVASGLARYGGDDGLTIYKRSDFRRPDRPVEPRAVLLSLPRLPVRRHLSDLAHRQFALRHGGAGPALQRAAHAGDRLSVPTATGWSASSSPAPSAASPARCSPTTPISSARPAMYWTRSGDLMVMVVLGGMGSLFGPVIGTIVFLLLEELLSQFTEYWALIMGPLLLLIVLFARGGIMGCSGGCAVAESPAPRRKPGPQLRRHHRDRQSSRSTSQPANCTPSSARTAPARPR